MARFGPTSGTSGRGPKYSKDTTLTDSTAREGLQYRWNPRVWCDFFEDFDGDVSTYTMTTTVTDNVSNAGINILPGANTNTAIAYVTVPRDGVLISAQLVAQDTLAANDTNYQTFALANTLLSGAGSTAMLAATDANTTKSTGGSALTAQIARSLTLNGTAANLRVNAGDVLLFTATATQSPTVSDAPTLTLRFRTLPSRTTPRQLRTTATSLPNLIDNTVGVANGEAQVTMSASNDAIVAGFDWNDQVIIPASRGCLFECRAKVGTYTTAQRFVIGLASAFNSTLDDTTNNIWFKCDAAMALKAEVDDTSTDTDDSDCATTLTADTYYLFRIDMTDTGAIEFYVNDDLVKTIAGAAFSASHLLQPVFWSQKDSGTGALTLTVDWYRCMWNRY